MIKLDWIRIVPSTSGTKVLTQTDGGLPSWESVSVGETVLASLTVSGATALDGGLTMDTNKFTVANTTGNTVVGGTLGVTGVTTLTAALNANGGIACDTDKFTVADTTGNTVVGGTLGVTGNVAVNTDKFTVAASSGNTLVAGTLAVTSDVAVATNKFTVDAASGNTLVAGTLSATGDVAINTNKFNITASSGATAVAGALTPTGGVAAAGGFSATARNVHTGCKPASASTDGTNLSVVVTELYVAEVFIPANCTVTGVAVFWGDATEGNAKVMLFNSAGSRVAISASTDVSGYTADSYGTNIAFSAPYAAVGPATYYVGVIGDNSGNRINTHVLGAFGAGKITGLVYATEAGYASITVPTTFTTGLGPYASLY